MAFLSFEVCNNNCQLGVYCIFIILSQRATNFSYWRRYVFVLRHSCQLATLEWLSFGHLQTIYTYTSLYPWCQYSALLSPHSSWQIPNVGLICGITRCWHDAYRNSGITETGITWRFRNRFTLTLSDAVKNGRPSSGRSVDKSYKYRDESILRIIALWLRVAKIKNQFTVHCLGLYSRAIFNMIKRHTCLMTLSL